jgi:type II secretory pathway pseudopilin PulG
MKKSFTLIEILVAMLLLSFVIVGSMKAYKYIQDVHKMNEVRYLALNRLDSEMNRLVFAYENFDEADFAKITVDTGTNVGIYKRNPLRESHGLIIFTSLFSGAISNYIEIIDGNNNPNEVGPGDIVGRLFWEREDINATHVRLSLSLRYPFFTEGDSVSESTELPWERLNLKTTTRIRQ